MTAETIAAMTEAQQVAYMETHPQRDMAYDRILADMELAPDVEPEEPERWDGQE